MKIKAVTFDLDDTLWPLREVIIHAHKESNNWIIDKFPNMSKVLFTEQEQKMWQKLIAKDNSLRHRLSELRMKVIETLLIENGVSDEDAKATSKDAFDIFLKLRHDITYFEGTLEVLKSLKEKYTLGVLTNGNASIKTLKIDHLFDFYLNAEMVNDSKPGAKMFKEARLHTLASIWCVDCDSLSYCGSQGRTFSLQSNDSNRCLHNFLFPRSFTAH